ncbi:MAG: type IV toxin-antitoxin system AbiEi family antitoxin domain-containing protein [Chloroflexota bacterium]|nr:type IV toxin-antitoxin system AbiEi family antitoxin domain-containing protein [Chloroflexota bacterium]
MEAQQERALFNIVKDKGGYFSLSQASTAGIRRNQIYRAVKQGTIERVYPGVYRLSLFPVGKYEEVFAALVSMGENAVVGFETALYVYGLSDIIPSNIHLIVPRSSSRRRSHVKMHTNKLDEQEITSFEGFRITTVERTLVDVLASHADMEQVRMAIAQAIAQGLTVKFQMNLNTSFFQI